MKNLLNICLLFLIIGCSCSSNDGKYIALLIEKLNIAASDGFIPDVVIIIPGNGCESCIEDAVNNIKVSDDTAYVFVCNSEKDFRLQTEGKKTSDYNNLYLDKKGISSEMGLVLSYPMVYFLKNGQYTNKEPYRPVKKQKNEQTETSVMLKECSIELGNIEMDGCYTDSIMITNIGDEQLFVSEIQTSCECTKAKMSEQVLSPSDSTFLCITFYPEDKGIFERFVYVYCNVKESPLEISIKGCVK